MASFPSKKNTAYTFAVGLISQSNPAILQSSPTLAAGDAKISIDGSALSNLTNLPIVTPPASKIVEVILTAAEMNGDKIRILFNDVAGSEWCDLLVELETSTRQIDDLLYPAYPIPDSVSADGSQPTLQQAINMINQFLQERDVAGSTVIVKKPDGSTTLMTFTLNNPTNPTSITRAT